jgi:LysM repeat protein
MRIRILLVAAIATLFTANTAVAQRRNQRYTEYVNTYKDIAVEQMKQYKIPASITLAQGLLESGAGTGTLARRSNNHFGIKCGSNWRGRTVRHDDDARGECFRAYSSPRESYRDHSIFLTSSARYASLFRLSITDYRGWATGLKRAGYATDPSYANRLITIIEDYELYKYDRQSSSSSHHSYTKRQIEKKPWLLSPHQVYIANDIAYVVARAGDSFEVIGKEMGMSGRSLAHYNDLDKDYTLQPGDIVYLKQKHKKAARQFTVHIVQPGESMHSISQKYAIRLKYLYKMNKKDGDYVPEIGDRLRVR